MKTVILASTLREIMQKAANEDKWLVRATIACSSLACLPRLATLRM